MTAQAAARPFHLAFPVTDLEATRTFYRDVLGCGIGREAPGHWIGFDLYGHQMSAHLHPASLASRDTGTVGSDTVPIPRFGVVLTMEQWNDRASRLEANSGHAGC